MSSVPMNSEDIVTVCIDHGQTNVTVAGDCVTCTTEEAQCQTHAGFMIDVDRMVDMEGIEFSFAIAISPLFHPSVFAWTLSCVTASSRADVIIPFNLLSKPTQHSSPMDSTIIEDHVLLLVDYSMLFLSWKPILQFETFEGWPIKRWLVSLNGPLWLAISKVSSIVVSARLFGGLA